MLLLGLGILLGPEADDRQQILDRAEHALLDHLADLLVSRPGRVLAVIVGAASGVLVTLGRLVEWYMRVNKAG